MPRFDNEPPADGAISIASLAWMAGILDLKGRVLRRKSGARVNDQISLIVETKEFAIVRQLGVLVGTAPEFRNAKPLSEALRRQCVEHCPEAHVHVNDDRQFPPISRWTLSGPAVLVVLEALRPYLQINRDYDNLIDEIRAVTPLNGRGSNAAMVSLARMRALGWPIPEPFASALTARTDTETTADGLIAAEAPASVEVSEVAA